MCVDVNGVVVGIIPSSKLNIQAIGLLIKPAAYFQTNTLTVNVPTVTPQSKVIAWLTPNQEWEAEDLVGYSLSAVPTINGIEFCIYNNGPIVGSYSVYYTWS